MHSRSMSLLASAVILGLVASFAPASVLLQDTFDDGNEGTNTLGVGGEYHTGTWNMTDFEEVNGVSEYVRRATGNWGNGGLITESTFDLWNADGLTFTWVIGKVDITTDDGDSLDYGHEMDLLKTSHTNPGKSNQHWNDGGGLSVQLDYELQDDGSITPYGQVVVNTSAKEAESQATGVLKAAKFALPDWNSIDWLTVKVFANEDGFQLAFSEAVGYGDTVAGFSDGGMTWAAVNALMGDLDPNEGFVTSSNLGTVRLGEIMANPDRGRGEGRTDLLLIEEGNTIPEPATMGMLAAGAVAALLRRRRA